MRFWNCNLIVVTGRFNIVVRYSAGKTLPFGQIMKRFCFPKRETKELSIQQNCVIRPFYCFLLPPASLVSVYGGHPGPDLGVLSGIVQEGVLPQPEHHHVGLVSGREGGEEVFLSSGANLHGVGDDQGRLLLGHGGHLTAGKQR